MAEINSALVEPGSPFHIDAKTVTTPGIEQTLLTFTAPSGPTALIRRLTSVIVTCRSSGGYRLLVNGSEVGSGRTGVAVPNASFQWYPSRPLPAGATIELKYICTGSQPSRTIEAYLMAVDRN